MPRKKTLTGRTEAASRRIEQREAYQRQYEMDNSEERNANRAMSQTRWRKKTLCAEAVQLFEKQVKRRRTHPQKEVAHQLMKQRKGEHETQTQRHNIKQKAMHPKNHQFSVNCRLK